MGFTVLRVSKAAGTQIEVIGEFPNKEQAEKFAQVTQVTEPTNGYDYMVEAPPSASPNHNPAEKVIPS